MRTRHDFLSKIPEDVRGRLSLEVPAACGTPGCDRGFIDTPLGGIPCPACKKAAQEARLGRAGLRGGRYDRSWDTLRLRHESWREVRELAHDVSALVQEGRNVALLGLPGRGTTQAAARLLMDAVEAQHSALLVSWPGWVETVQSDYTRHLQTQAEHVERLTVPALVALDGVGEASSASGALERKLLERVLGVRFAAGRGTVVTSHLNRRELEVALGDVAFDRLRHNCEWVVFNGPNEREEEARLAASPVPLQRAAGGAS